MQKYAIAAVVACLYVALSAWLVQSAGQAHRSALVQARGQLAGSESPAVAPAGEPQVAAPGNEANSPVAARVNAPRAEAATASPAAATTSPASKPAAGKRARSIVAAAPASKRPVRPTTDMAKSKPEGSLTREQLLAKLDPFWRLPAATEKWQLADLSAADEKRLGAELHQMIMHFSNRVQSGPYLERVVTVARPLLERRSRKDIEYTFTVIDSEEVNAFSLPGGHVYVSRGLFSFLGQDEDAALRFVLAHEIAHVDLKHMIACLQDPGVQSLDMGTLWKVYFLILPLGYPDAQEYAADAWAYRQVMQIDESRYDALKFLRKLKDYAESHGFYDGRAHYRPGVDSTPVSNHLRAHTAAWDRLNHLEEVTAPASTPSR
jgi:Zn-dependent protease with chaperone function